MRERPDQERDELPAAGDSALSLFVVARALGEALTADQVASALFDHALSLLGASTVGLWMVADDGVIRLSASAGAGSAVQVGDIPADSDLPAAIAVRTGEIVTFDGRQERDRRWPGLGHIDTTIGKVVVAPLSARGRKIGAMHVGWLASTRGTGAPTEPDLPLLGALADLGAGALDRAQLYEAERRAHETLEFLNQGTRLMVSALDPELIVQSLVRLAVPRLAPWCAVYVAEGDELVRTAAEVADNEGLAAAVRTAGPIAVDADVPVAQVFRSGTALVIPVVQPDHVRQTYEPEVADRILGLPEGPWTGLIVPIEAGGNTIGVMSLLSPDWAGNPPTEVRYAAEGLAGRAGVSLRNARRYREQVDSVTLLSKALLPEAMPDVAGLRFTARYVPSAGGGVGGDWYDVEVMPDGLVLVGIGDASGHGIPAAATMALVRNAARGLAVAGIRPGRMLEHLSALVNGDVSENIATTIYGLFDHASGEGIWANAGHPLPLLVAPDGAVTLVEELTPGPPVGAGVFDYGEAKLRLAPGSRLVLYTDGLFERRGANPAVGIDRLVDLLRGVVHKHEGADPAVVDNALADSLVRSRPESSDDGCVLIVGR